jgi:hypothetical protein
MPTPAPQRIANTAPATPELIGRQRGLIVHNDVPVAEQVAVHLLLGRLVRLGGVGGDGLRTPTLCRPGFGSCCRVVQAKSGD